MTFVRARIAPCLYLRQILRKFACLRLVKPSIRTQSMPHHCRHFELIVAKMVSLEPVTATLIIRRSFATNPYKPIRTIFLKQVNT